MQHDASLRQRRAPKPMRPVHRDGKYDCAARARDIRIRADAEIDRVRAVAKASPQDRHTHADGAGERLHRRHRHPEDFFKYYWDTLLDVPGTRFHRGKYLPQIDHTYAKVLFGPKFIRNAYASHIDDWLALRQRFDPAPERF
jgi:hypothetical protein